MRRVETAVREAEDAKWKRTNPEAAARARSLVDQLEGSLAGIQQEVAAAEAAGDESKAAAARERLSAQQEWLAQARSNLDEFGG